ncbi:MAG: translation initiation factor IF-2 [Alphaproteobacteria bacterium CG11_big_fil_rev_8_21_14_0_20_39_49]|nr:MAG: translation initiation factor IF-2 [Alphaproteobacteria bacterium CG11_big_fil_rev_8_21_14_0_20_39_49]
MTEKTDNTNKKSTLTLSSSKLKLGDIKGGHVSQSLSHGRAKSVQVEVRKKRRFASTLSNENTVNTAGSGDVRGNDGLTDSEREKRLKVLQQASDYEKEKNEKEAEQSRIAQERAEEKARKEQEDAEAAAKLAEEMRQKREEKKAAESPSSEANAVSENDSVKPIKSNEKLSLTVKDKSKKDRENEKEERKPSRTSEAKRRSGKLTIAQALSNNGEERMRSLASVRRAREKARKASESDNGSKEKQTREVTIPEIITVQELANRMAERAVDVTKSLMKMGMMVTANQTIDADTAELVVEEFGHRTKRVTDADVEDILKDEGVDNNDNLIHKAPVVTFMGHVDHGKTSLLDKIREAKVASGEAGGITQHIGAYQVEVDKEHKITFLDTPGHEAFTAMRQRGANATDIVVLVVAADDGIMAQTVEAINHAKAAEVPIIIAINKIDKPEADANRVRTSLLEHELVTEDMGGDVLAVEVSAKTGQNLDKLLETILIQAEMLELRANPNRKASGIVVEARVDKNKGVVSTLLVQKGTLKVGDIVIVGEAVGKVRAMKSAEGRVLSKALPSVPVEIMGLDQAPEAGVEFHVVDSEKQAREIKEYRQKLSRDLKAATQKKKGTLEDLFLQAKDGGKKQLPIIIKGDVQGSVEAILGSLDKLETTEVAVKALHTAAGAISTSDIALAKASHAIILAFNVRADGAAKELAQKEGADIRYYSIIYDLIDDIKAMLGGMLDPHIREQYLGNAEIREVFNMSKHGKVAGCYVTDGNIKRGSGVRLLRDNVVIHEGKLKTLKRFKDDVKEVGTNFECGMAFENYEDLKVGDVIEAFELIEEQRTL